MREKNVHAVITAQTKQAQGDYEATIKRQEIIQEIDSTDRLTHDLAERLIKKVHVFPGDRIEIEYATQDFFALPSERKEA